jgi:acetate---CoA ligase (ADP-forming)
MWPARRPFAMRFGESPRPWRTLEAPCSRSSLSGGVEAFIGVVRDPQFGHLLALGCGGTLVELLEDVVCRLHPLTDVDARRCSPSPHGGSPDWVPWSRVADVDALKEILLRVSSLITLVPEIAELDLNPVLVQPAGSGAMVPDARIRIAHGDLTPDAAHSAR